MVKVSVKFNEGDFSIYGLEDTKHIPRHITRKHRLSGSVVSEVVLLKSDVLVIGLTKNDDNILGTRVNKKRYYMRGDSCLREVSENKIVGLTELTENPRKVLAQDLSIDFLQTMFRDTMVQKISFSSTFEVAVGHAVVNREKVYSTRSDRTYYHFDIVEDVAGEYLKLTPINVAGHSELLYANNFVVINVGDRSALTKGLLINCTDSTTYDKVLRLLKITTEDELFDLCREDEFSIDNFTVFNSAVKCPQTLIGYLDKPKPTINPDSNS